MTEAPKLLNVEQAAIALGLSESTLNQARVRGGGPAFIKVGRRCLYDPKDLNDWISSRRRQSTSDRESVR